MDPVLIDATLGLALVLPLPNSGKVQSRIGAWFDQGLRWPVPRRRGALCVHTL